MLKEVHFQNDADYVESFIVGFFMFSSLLIGHLCEFSKPYWIPISCLAVMQGATTYHIWSSHQKKEINDHQVNSEQLTSKKQNKIGLLRFLIKGVSVNDTPISNFIYNWTKGFTKFSNLIFHSYWFGV